MTAKATRSSLIRHRIGCSHHPPSEHDTLRNAARGRGDHSRWGHSRQNHDRKRLPDPLIQRHPWCRSGVHKAGNHRYWWGRMIALVCQITKSIGGPNTHSKLMSCLGTVMVLMRRMELYSTGTGIFECVYMENAKRKREKKREIIAKADWGIDRALFIFGMGEGWLRIPPSFNLCNQRCKEALQKLVISTNALRQKILSPFLIMMGCVLVIQMRIKPIWHSKRRHCASEKEGKFHGTCFLCTDNKMAG